MTETLFIKPGSHVTLSDDVVEKRMSEAEHAAYAYLESFGSNLDAPDVCVVTPRMYTYDPSTRMARLSRIGTFPNLRPQEYFGEWDGYSQSYFGTMDQVFSCIRERLPAAHVPDTTDYEAMAGEIPSSVEYLRRGVPADSPGMLRAELAKIAKLAVLGQEQIAQLPQYPAHRDPNPNNFLMHDDGRTVGAVDWETFGLARTGYEEGRMCTYLSLQPELQERYIQSYCEAHTDSAGQLYFWRVAGMRSLREISSFHTGHYDSRLGETAEPGKQKIIQGLQALMQRSIDEQQARIS